MYLLEVCVGSSCHLRGAYDVVKEFQRLIEETQMDIEIELKACFCMGNCREGVNVRLNEEIYAAVTKENAARFFDEVIIHQKPWNEVKD